MPKFITHEPLAAKLLNKGHSTAQGALLPWANQLSNTEELLNLLVSRMESDYQALAVKMRKPWTASAVEPRQPALPASKEQQPLTTVSANVRFQ